MVALATLATGCSRWIAGPAPAPTPVPTPVAGKARIDLKDGRTFEVTNLTVSGDSLFGDAVRRKGTRVAVAVSEVRTIRTHQSPSTRTWVIAGLVVLLLIVTGGISIESS